MPSASRSTTPVGINMDIVEGRYAQLDDHTVSFEHLYTLLSRADTDVSVVALVGGGFVKQSGLELLDDEARRAYRARLDALDTEENTEERAWLLDQLRAATGRCGRRRTTGAHDERARVAVRKAIVAALAKIAETDPWLGRHLRDRVRTGFECRYEPDPDHPIRWILQAAPG